MKLLIETTEDFEVIYEEVSGKKQMFIEGIFMQAETVNRNGRIYPKAVMEGEVARFTKEQINQGTAAGELGHPQGPQMNLDRISHRITSLKMDGNNVIGKALVLDTEAGKTAKALIEGGFRMGVSSRALGTVKETTSKMGSGTVKVVQPDFKLFAIDMVSDPSAPDAFVSPIMEATEWEFRNGVWVSTSKLNESVSIDPHKVSVKTRHAYYNLFKEL